MVRQGMKRKINITIDAEVLRWVQAEAEADNRSLSNMIESLIRKAMPKPPKKPDRRTK